MFQLLQNIITNSVDCGVKHCAWFVETFLCLPGVSLENCYTRMHLRCVGIHAIDV